MPTIVRIRGGGCVGKSSGSTRPRLWKGFVSTSVILNHCIRTRFLFFLNSNDRVGVAEFYLQIFVGMLVSRIGSESGGWASVPLWCILLPARVVGFTVCVCVPGTVR